MLNLLRQHNFALLWWGGLISLTGNRVLSVALPFYVYAETGSTIATAAMVMATIVPSMLFSSIAGVLVDRWDRRQAMVVTNLLLAVVLLPLLAISVTGWIWLVYLVAFVETTISLVFRLAENALLPQVVTSDQLLSANSLNSLNDTLARLIGPALGGVLLAVWGLESVILFDSLSYLLAGLLVFAVVLAPEQSRASPPPSDSTYSLWRQFQQEWREGIAIVRRERTIAALFLVIGITTMGGTMMDPLNAPFVYEILRGTSAVFGWIVMIQAIGSILGGLMIGQLARRISPATLFGISNTAVGIALLLMYQSVSLSAVLVLSLLVGILAVGSRVGMQTLLQQSVADAYRGRVFGLLTTVGSILELFSVGLAGIMAEQVGIVPLLSVAAGITILAGITSLWLFPRLNRNVAIGSR